MRGKLVGFSFADECPGAGSGELLQTIADDLSSRAHQNFAQSARDGHVVFDNQNSDLSKHNLRPLFETVVSLGLAGTRANASQSRQPFNFMSEQTLFADEPVCI